MEKECITCAVKISRSVRQACLEEIDESWCTSVEVGQCFDDARYGVFQEEGAGWHLGFVDGWTPRAPEPAVPPTPRGKPEDIEDPTGLDRALEKAKNSVTEKEETEEKKEEARVESGWCKRVRGSSASERRRSVVSSSGKRRRKERRRVEAEVEAARGAGVERKREKQSQSPERVRQVQLDEEPKEIGRQKSEEANSGELYSRKPRRSAWQKKAWPERGRPWKSWGGAKAIVNPVKRSQALPAPP